MTSALSSRLSWKMLVTMLAAAAFLDLITLTVSCDAHTEGFLVEVVLTDSYSAQEEWLSSR